ncbi:hypothetical protein BH10PSE19_BH10PSE19_06490 [soil metagenome]
MSSVKKTISISKELVEQANALSNNFSAVVETALVEYIHHMQIKKAKESFGQWENRKEDSIELVNQLREDRSTHADNLD